MPYGSTCHHAKYADQLRILLVIRPLRAGGKVSGCVSSVYVSVCAYLARMFLIAARTRTFCVSSSHLLEIALAKNNGANRWFSLFRCVLVMEQYNGMKSVTYFNSMAKVNLTFQVWNWQEVILNQVKQTIMMILNFVTLPLNFVNLINKNVDDIRPYANQVHCLIKLRIWICSYTKAPECENVRGPCT